jgi:IclR family transcriptional regulator, acetate operon repressor
VRRGAKDAGEGEPDRYMVRSVVRAIGVLETLAERGSGEGLSVTEIAESCDLSKSAAFAVLHTLRAHGFVADDGTGQTRRYRLGMALSRLGERARDQLSLPDLARPILRELTADSGLSSRLAVLQNDSAVSIDRIDAPSQIRIDLRMGARELMHCTGVGKAMLAHLPDDEVRRIVAATGMPRRTSHTITDVDALLAHVKEVRRVGYAIDDEEDAEGIMCVGSAVRDEKGACVGAISVTGLKAGGTADRVQELGQATRTAAERLSQRLGFDAAHSSR